MNYFPLALEEYKKGRNAAALNYAHLGLKLAPKDARLLFLAGIISVGLQEFSRAAEYFKGCLEVDRTNVDAVLNLGSVYQELGDLASAARQFAAIPESSTLRSKALLNLAMIHTINGELQQAEELYVDLMKRKNRPDDFFLNYGLFLFQQGKLQESMEQYQLGIQVSPNDKKLWLNLSAVYNVLGEFQHALDGANQALKLDPGYADAWVSRGLLLSRIGDIGKAIDAFQHALRLNKKNAQAWLGMGAIRHQLGDYEFAKSAYLNAVRLDPGMTAALFNLGSVCLDLGEYKESLAYSLATLDQANDYPFAFGNLFFAKMQIGDWGSYSTDIGYIRKALSSGKPVSTPFVALTAVDDPALHRACAEGWFKEKVSSFESEPGPTRQKNDRIRVGYVSSDFREHPVAYLIAELFELHDRRRFYVVCIGWSAESDDLMLRRIKTSCDLYIDAAQMTDAAVAELIRQNRIDILIDLNGYTKGARTGIFARRPSPVQLSYIGYLGSMHAPCYQYLIVDRYIIPEGSIGGGGERRVYLPTYQVNDRKRPLPQYERQESLETDSESNFAFCCLNNNYKLNPEVCSLWVEILDQAPHSSLLLAGGLDEYEKNIRDWFSKKSIDQNRIRFLPRTSRDGYLAAYLECDLFLDTFPYNAGTTGSDALWMGVPLITLIGDSMPARYGLSLLQGVGLGELAVKSKAEYVGLALELYRDRVRLRALTSHLETVRDTAPLFNSPMFVRKLESAFQEMVAQLGQEQKDIFL